MTKPQQEKGERIYIVYGQTGEYEDRREWTVRGFRSEELANRYARMCDEQAKELRGIHGPYLHSTDRELAGVILLDPFFSCDSKTDYIVGNLDVFDDISFEQAAREALG